jgi:rieske iron-sulfur protein
VTTTASTGSVPKTNAGAGNVERRRRILRAVAHRPAEPSRLMAGRGAEPGASCPCGVAAPGRRTLLAAGVGVGVGLAARVAPAQSDAAHDRPKMGDLLVKVDNTEPAPLGPDSLPLGTGQVMAWPMDPVGNVVRSGSRLNKVLLVRLDPKALDARTEGRAADGVVAYSAICPHAGCEVVNWSADRQILECPCHNSQYDPKSGARVIAGPSPRGLAALPLRIADGKLTVAQPFIGRLGIQQV